jgi:hypothetical protein
MYASETTEAIANHQSPTVVVVDLIAEHDPDNIFVEVRPMAKFFGNQPGKRQTGANREKIKPLSTQTL